MSRQGTTEALCEEFASVCESAVDPLEIASALESRGVNDATAQATYGFSDVFTLADEMYLLVPRRPAEPEQPPDPWQFSRLRPLLRGLLYGAPAVCFPAATGLLIGPGVLVALIVALLAAWSLSQAVAHLGYQRLGRGGPDPARHLLRAGLAGALVVLTIALAMTALLSHARLPVLSFGAGEGAYMLAACVLLVLDAGQWLLVALAPGVLGSAVFLIFGRPQHFERFALVALAATPLLALAMAVVCTKTKTPRTGPLCTAAELRGALPAAGFGLAAAGLLAFPVAAGVHGHGGVNTGALLATVPISLSMGAAEWSLLWYRRRTRELLRTTEELRAFTAKARRVLVAAVLQYAVAAVVLMAVVVPVAAAAGFVHPHWAVVPQMAAYVALGSAMFLSLMVQAVGLRTFTLVASSVALAFEILFRHLGVPAQLVACCGLLMAVGAYAIIELSKAVRHSY
jgi:hypothetical protein